MLYLKMCANASTPLLYLRMFTDAVCATEDAFKSDDASCATMKFADANLSSNLLITIT